MLTHTHTHTQMFETYLQFVGIAITNAQLMEASQLEYERNRVSHRKRERGR